MALTPIKLWAKAQKKIKPPASHPRQQTWSLPPGNRAHSHSIPCECRWSRTPLIGREHEVLKLIGADPNPDPEVFIANVLDATLKSEAIPQLDDNALAYGCGQRVVE